MLVAVLQSTHSTHTHTHSLISIPFISCFFSSFLLREINLWFRLLLLFCRKQTSTRTRGILALAQYIRNGCAKIIDCKHWICFLIRFVALFRQTIWKLDSRIIDPIDCARVLLSVRTHASRDPVWIVESFHLFYWPDGCGRTVKGIVRQRHESGSWSNAWGESKSATSTQDNPFVSLPFNFDDWQVERLFAHSAQTHAHTMCGEQNLN